MSYRVVMKDAFKGYTIDQDKICTPKDTVDRFKKKLDSLDLSILEKIVRIDNGRLDIPIYFSLCGKDAMETIGTNKQMGKGGTPDQSQASAVMELAERYSFFSFCKDPKNFITETYKNLKDRALPFNIIAQSVHDSETDLEIGEKIFSNIPIQWTRGYNLTTEKEVLVPFDWFFTINEFNGPSAGNCVEEALSQGICEIVERHVSSIISRDRLKTPLISMDSVNDPLVLEMLGKFKKIGVTLAITDFSLNTGIPTVGILAYDPSTFPQKSELVWTAGTTPDPQKALSRALTEVAQLAGDFNSGSNYVASGLPKFTNLEDADFVLHPGETIEITQLPNLSNNNIRIEVENCISALSNIGMEVIVINTTHNKLEIPAFYTIVPGAHFRERASNTSIGLFCAKLIADKGNPSWAMNELNAMDKLLPKKYFTKFFMGTTSLSMGETTKALGYLEAALELDPGKEDIPSIYSYIGTCLKDLERYKDSLNALKKAEAFDSERTDIYNLMGFCYFKLKEHEKAIDCFKKTLRLDPSSAIDYANIASNYRELGDKERAIQHYELALELDPTLDFARENLERLK